jgi:glycosyltransferase involved in cell wall biosynthesis
MDLVGNMLHRSLVDLHAESYTATLVRPNLPFSANSKPHLFTRLFGRFIHYPRELRRIQSEFDLFHIVDHSYAHLVHELPPERTVVSCHDIDTFRCLLPSNKRRDPAFRWMSRRILTGLQQAAHVLCDTEATRRELLDHGLLSKDKTTVVHNGVHPSLSPNADHQVEAEVTKLLGRAPGVVSELLHVGSTIPRKRIDVLLQAVAKIRSHNPQSRLLRVGGAFAPTQQGLARALGIAEAIDVLPKIDERLLAAVYRRSALLLQTSDSEGFGLPVIEAMACGTPVVASDIAPLREVGGTAATYSAVGDVEQLTDHVLRLLSERDIDPTLWKTRRQKSLTQSSQFTWAAYAAKMVAIYERVIQ